MYLKNLIYIIIVIFLEENRQAWIFNILGSLIFCAAYRIASKLKVIMPKHETKHCLENHSTKLLFDNTQNITESKE